MGTIQPQFNPPADAFGQDRYTAGNGYAFSREAMVAETRTSSMDLAITTREGDRVTFSSSSRVGFEAISYDRLGRMETPKGTLEQREQFRSLTLATGQSFSFSVEGDLSQEELEDIDAILKTLDQVMTEMVSGDMDKALKTALGMDGYDTVSGFTADLAYEQSMTAAVAQNQWATSTLPGNGFDQGHGLKRPDNDPAQTVIREMMNQLAEQDLPLIRQAKGPVGKLMAHHRTQGRGREDLTESMLQGLTDVLSTIQERLENLFEQVEE